MASIHKDPRGRSPFYYAAITLPTGRRAFRSTKSRTRAEALGIAAKWQREATAAAKDFTPESAQLVLERFIDLTQRAQVGDFNEDTARAALDELLKAAGKNPMQNRTVRAWFAEWMDGKSAAGELSGASRVAYRAAAANFLEALGARADANLSSITTADVEHFRRWRIGTGISAQTLDRDLKVLRIAFKRALAFGLISTDPTAAVPLASRKNKRKAQVVQRETFTAAELEAITAAATGDWRTCIMLARYTGARLSDCAAMRWGNIDLAENVVRFCDAKTSRDMAIPLHPRLQQHLLTHASVDDERAYVCPALAGKGTGGCNGLSAQFGRILAAAGVDDRRQETKALKRREDGTSRTLARRSFHSIRHTYNSALANLNVSQEVRRKLVGHSTDEMNDLYTKLDLAVFREAVGRLP